MHDLTDAIAAAHAALDERFHPGPTEDMVACIVEAAAPVIEKQIREQVAGAVMTDNLIPHTISDRGLAYPEPIPTEYGELVSTYDSSAATRDCIWLGIGGEMGDDGGWGEWNAHLTFDQAERLIMQMQWLMSRRANQ